MAKSEPHNYWLVFAIGRYTRATNAAGLDADFDFLAQIWSYFQWVNSCFPLGKRSGCASSNMGYTRGSGTPGFLKEQNNCCSQWMLSKLTPGAKLPTTVSNRGCDDRRGCYPSTPSGAPFSFLLQGSPFKLNQQEKGSLLSHGHWASEHRSNVHPGSLLADSCRFPPKQGGLQCGTPLRQQYKG